MRIVEPGKRYSDQISLKVTAERLGIPVSDAELVKTASDKTAEHTCEHLCPAHNAPVAQCQCPCQVCPPEAKKAETTRQCVKCGAVMTKTSDDMDYCVACGYADVPVAKPPHAPQASSKDGQTKTAAEVEKSVLEYYKKIYPDDYAKELTGTPKSPPVGTQVSYGLKGASVVVDAKEVVAVAPPGWEKTVKKMKKHKKIDNPWALAWWMKEKGYKPSK
jgi:hypothetical protein